MDASVEACLTRLQQVLRKNGDEKDVMAWMAPPGRHDQRAVGLSKEQDDALADVEWSLEQDPRFDHLAGKGRDAAVSFIFNCDDDPKSDHVPAFMATHAREVETRVCYFPVEYLTVSEARETFGIRLLPLADPQVPPPSGRFTLQPPVGCVAAADVTGTSLDRMARRGREQSDRALRRLRIALHEHRGIHDIQLRFRLGDAYSFGDRLSGWAASPESAHPLGLDSELVAIAEASPLVKAAAEPKTRQDVQVELATKWIERAMFTGDPLISLLYLFFALEALLGDKSDRLKGHELAVRQMTLSSVVDGGFTHPNETFFLYDQVRSAAVHGERAPEVSWEVVNSFAWLVRRTLNQYLTYAAGEGVQRRSRLLRSWLNAQTELAASNGSKRAAGQSGIRTSRTSSPAEKSR